MGTIFKMSPAGDLLGSFPVYGGADIAFPNAPLVLGTDGAFYSTSYNSGGVVGSGAVYQFSAAGVVTVLHGFNDTPDGNRRTAASSWAAMVTSTAPPSLAERVTSALLIGYPKMAHTRS